MRGITKSKKKDAKKRKAEVLKKRKERKNKLKKIEKRLKKESVKKDGSATALDPPGAAVPQVEPPVIREFITDWAILYLVKGRLLSTITKSPRPYCIVNYGVRYESSTSKGFTPRWNDVICMRFLPSHKRMRVDVFDRITEASIGFVRIDISEFQRNPDNVFYGRFALSQSRGFVYLAMHRYISESPHEKSEFKGSEEFSGIRTPSILRSLMEMDAAEDDEKIRLEEEIRRKRREKDLLEKKRQKTVPTVKSLRSVIPAANTDTFESAPIDKAADRRTLVAGRKSGAPKGKKSAEKKKKGGAKGKRKLPVLRKMTSLERLASDTEEITSERNQKSTERRLAGPARNDSGDSTRQKPKKHSFVLFSSINESSAERGTANNAADTYSPPILASDHARTVSIGIERINGYRGRSAAAAAALFVSEPGDFFYCASRFGIIENIQSKRQRFFLGHSGEINNCAMHWSRKYVATASGNDRPTVYIWRTSDCGEVSRVGRGVLPRGRVTAMCFGRGQSTDSTLIIASEHEKNAITVFDWESGRVLATGYGAKARMLAISCFKDKRLFTTCGANSLDLWSYDNGVLVNEMSLTSSQTYLSSASIGSILFVSAASGYVFVYDVSMKTFSPRAKFRAHSGAANALRRVGPRLILSGGDDGFARVWDVSTLKKPKQKFAETRIRSGPVVSCDAFRDFGLLIGTVENKVWSVRMSQGAGNPRVLVCGHGDNVHGLGVLECPAPRGRFVASCSSDRSIIFWDESGRAVSNVSISGQPRCLAFLPLRDGSLCCAGLENGEVVVLRLNRRRRVAKMLRRRDASDSIVYVGWSPDRRFLGVLFSAGGFCIYDVKESYECVARVSIEPVGAYRFVWDKGSEYLLFFREISKSLYRVRRSSARGECAVEPCNASESFILAKFGDVESRGGGVILDRDSEGRDLRMVGGSRVLYDSKVEMVGGHPCPVSDAKFFGDDRVVTTGVSDHSVIFWRVVRD